MIDGSSFGDDGGTAVNHTEVEERILSSWLKLWSAEKVPTMLRR
jgi:hypothetical protein